MTRYLTFYISMILLIICYMVSFAILALISTIEDVSTDLYLAQHKQLMEDWQALPFVDITLVKPGPDLSQKDHKLVCPEEYEPLMQKEWPGT